MNLHTVNYQNNLVQVFQKRLLYSTILCFVAFGIALVTLLFAFNQYEQKTSMAYIHHLGSTLQVMVKTQPIRQK